MIIKIVKKTSYSFNGSVEYEFIDNENIITFGEVLNAAQKNNLKYFGNTVISKAIYDAFSESKLKAEIKRITGINVIFSIIPHEYENPTVLVLKK